MPNIKSIDTTNSISKLSEREGPHSLHTTNMSIKRPNEGSIIKRKIHFNRKSEIMDSSDT